MGRPANNLINQRFGKLVVLERDISKPSGTGKSVYWICQCDCGNKKSIRADKLKNHTTISCGCYIKEIRSQMFLKNLTGQKIGKLTILKRDETKPMGKEHFAYWICQCECGNITSVRGDHLRNKTTLSCGCLNSKGEMKISQILKENNINFKTQYTFPDLKVQELLRFDFAILDNNNNLIQLIEYQGKQHFIPYHFDTEDCFNKRLKYDNIKRQYCKEHNLSLIEIPYTDFQILSFEYFKEKGVCI